MNGGRCPDCGAPAAGTEGCQELFEALALREIGDFRYARWHRLGVDAYALQHPDRYCRSAKSLAAHLTGACAALEREDALETNRAVQRWLSTNPPLERPEPPAERGELTIADVLQASDPDTHGQLVRAWASSAYAAWSAHHGLARRWIAAATRPRLTAVR